MTVSFESLPYHTTLKRFGTEMVVKDPTTPPPPLHALSPLHYKLLDRIASTILEGLRPLALFFVLPLTSTSFHSDYLMIFSLFLFTTCKTCVAGRAIAQAASHRLSTAAAWVRSQVKSCGICGGKVAMRQVCS
jgi:hypothetical protein